ncbi:MAG: PIN domain-containing protein [Candidatus Methylomirabilota bacterium]
MSVLVDSSVWIAYFRGAGDPDLVECLIDENLVVTNDLILAELIPPLHLRNQKRLIGLLKEIKRFPFAIDWDDIVRMQITCLRAGINGVGIPDLIIAQHAIRNRLLLCSLDAHFRAMSRHLPLSLYEG